MVQGEDVSENHATIMKEKGSWFLAVMGRSRPTLINDKKVKKQRLADGDEIRIGDDTLVFKEYDQPKADNSKDLREENQTYRTIVAFSEELLASADLPALLDKMMDMVVKLTVADRGFLVLFEAGEPVVKVARNIQQQSIDDPQELLSDTIIEKVVREQEALIVADALHHEEFRSAASVMSLKLNSVMCVPLMEAGQLFGILYVGSNQAVNLFQQHHLEVLTIFAANASLMIQNAIQKDNLRGERDELKDELARRRFGELLGSCKHMETVYKTIRKVAPTDVGVLITGDTGTGKELVAQEIHRRSNRTDKPFVVINCGAIPENLLESELFGHVKGAFTGAVATRTGKFQQAHGGTLFLDEIGEMPAPLQVKLLRAIQEKVVTKVGATLQENVDIRILAATNKNLEQEIAASRFREDLYYRLNVVCVHLPPLRDRAEDIMLLAYYFIKKYTREYNTRTRDFTPQTVVTIKKYAWPGNIRQLENRIRKAVIMADTAHIRPEDMDLGTDHLGPVLSLAQAKEEFQRTYINEVLARNNDNRTKTAKDLGVDPRTIFRHLEKEGALGEGEEV